RSRTLRRARLARLPSSCFPDHRGIRIPHLRTGRDSPLSGIQSDTPQNGLPTPRLPTPRIHQCDLIAMSLIRSPRSGLRSSTLWYQTYQGVLVASAHIATKICDTVRLAVPSLGSRTSAMLAPCGSQGMLPIALPDASATQVEGLDCNVIL